MPNCAINVIHPPSDSTSINNHFRRNALSSLLALLVSRICRSINRPLIQTGTAALRHRQNTTMSAPPIKPAARVARQEQDVLASSAPIPIVPV